MGVSKLFLPGLRWCRPPFFYLPYSVAFSNVWHRGCVTNGVNEEANVRIEAIFILDTSNHFSERRPTMLRWALIFLVVALIAGALGMFRTEVISAQIAWILFVVFLILAVVSMVVGRSSGPPV
jgi:uncharacterized membrane protein YtjA (UPF0391 family)